MASMALMSIKADAKAKELEEKRIQDRRKAALVLCLRYLVDQGYSESAERLQVEARVSLRQWDVADNIDLLTLIQDFEEYYEVKFGRKPKLVRRGEGADALDSSSGANKPGRSSRLPRISSSNGSASKDAAEATRKRGAARTEGDASSSNGDCFVNGHSITANGSRRNSANGPLESEAREESFHERLLKPLPDFGSVELRDMAALITRDIYLENPNVRWESIAGLDAAKQLLKEAVVMPIKFPQYFRGLLAPWKGILLYGPPGTGKTLLAKAVATECHTTFFNISASTIVSKWRGDSEKLVRVLFDLARHHAPSTIFMDEIDALIAQRGEGPGENEASRRMKTELLIQMDGLAKSEAMVFVLAATNLPWELDTAMLRRLEKRILVPLPGPEARRHMVEGLLKGSMASGVPVEEMVASTEGYSGSDIRLLCKEAAMRPLRRLMQALEAKGNAQQKEADMTLGPITHEDIGEALKVTKSTAQVYADKFSKFTEDFGSQA